MRSDWVSKRKNDKVKTQMHYAKKGIITEEMEYVADVEGLSSELIRSEVARGRMIIPANINHKHLKPMAIGIAAKCKINSNIGSSSLASNPEAEVEKVNEANTILYSPSQMCSSTDSVVNTIRESLPAAQ